MFETTKDRSPLLPDRHPTPDFFVCDIFDAVPKGDMASMEHPVFSISTKPDQRIRRYESPDKTQFIEITPSVKGLATVHDRDILIFCISQIIAALNANRKVDRTVRFKAFDLLTATNRPTGGESYARLKEAFVRLRGTTITTNITTGDIEQMNMFGLVDKVDIVRETREGRMMEVQVTLSEWVFNAIQAREVLTIHRDYFRLRKPLERRVYEIGRKQCGVAGVWRIGLDKLKMKCGSNSTDKEFKRLISKIVADDQANAHMPDYALSLEPSAQFGRPDNLVFTNRKALWEKAQRDSRISMLTGSFRSEVYEEARSIARGRDIYLLEREWREWMSEQEMEPRHPERAFLGFCRKKGPLQA